MDGGRALSKMQIAIGMVMHMGIVRLAVMFMVMIVAEMSVIMSVIVVVIMVMIMAMIVIHPTGSIYDSGLARVAAAYVAHDC